MPKVTTKRKKADLEEPVDEGILDMFGKESNKDNDNEEESGKNALSVDMDALVTRLDKLEARNTALERANMQLMSFNPVKSAQVDTQPDINLDNLPDPIDNPKEYVKALNERIVGVVDQRTKNLNAQSQEIANSNARVNALWQDFADQYEDYAEFQDRIGYIATKVVQKMQARGVDTDKYMFGNSGVFFMDVINEYDKTFGKPVDEADVEVEEPEERPVRRKAKRSEVVDEDDEDDGRSESVFGGLASPSGRKGKQGKDEAGDMIKDLQDLQRASGFFGHFA